MNRTRPAETSKPDWTCASGSRAPFEILCESGDRVGIRFIPTIERLTEPFEIREGAVLPVGSYHFERFVALLEFSNKRPISGRIRFEGGSYYDGNRTSVQVRASWRPRPGLTFALNFERNVVHLDEDNFKTNLARLRVQVDFTADLSWSTFVQWDDVSDEVGINSRLRWIIEPGNDLFLVFNYEVSTGAPGGETRFRSLDSEVTFKVAWTFRF